MFANGCPCTKAALVAGVVAVAGADGCPCVLAVGAGAWPLWGGE